MGTRASAALRATLVTVIGGALMLVPVANALVLIFVMLPLWVVSNLGVPGLGHELNGFFLPSVLGWSLIAGMFWAISFMVFLERHRPASGR